jgi:hypothetical protein
MVSVCVLDYVRTRSALLCIKHPEGPSMSNWNKQMTMLQAFQPHCKTVFSLCLANSAMTLSVDGEEFKHDLIVRMNSLKIYQDVYKGRGITPPFLSSALNGGEWSVQCPCPFHLEKSPTPIGHGAGSTPEPVWALWNKETSHALAGNRNQQSNASLYRLIGLVWGSE